MGWAEVWRWRSALMYTVGSWTVFGCIIYYSSSQIGPKVEEGEEKPAVHETGSTISEDGLKETFVYRTPGSNFTVVSTTVYNPNRVPFNTRLNNFIQSFFADSGGKAK